jgi:hypothetical protein
VGTAFTLLVVPSIYVLVARKRRVAERDDNVAVMIGPHESSLTPTAAD